MAQNIESYLPGVRDNGGLATNEPATFSTTATFASTITGQQTPIVNLNVSKGTTSTLTIGQSGTTVVVNSTSGSLITLPAPTAGVYFELVYLTAASGTHAVATNSTGAVFLQGAVTVSQTANFTGATFLADGVTHSVMQMNGGTTGGTAGTYVMLTCASSSVWIVEGNLVGNGQLVTPFKTTT